MYKKFNVLLGDWIASVAKKGFWFQFWIPVIFALKPGLRSWLRQHKKVLSKKSMYVSADKKRSGQKKGPSLKIANEDQRNRVPNLFCQDTKRFT